MPFICWYCFFYLLCLTYFTEGAGSNLSILKEAKKNYLGRFIFPGGGDLFAYSYAKKCTNTSAATFNITTITISLK